MNDKNVDLLVLAPQVEPEGQGSMPLFLREIMKLQHANITVENKFFFSSRYLKLISFVIYLAKITFFCLCKPRCRIIVLSQEFIVPIFLARQHVLFYDLIQAYVPRKISVQWFYSIFVPWALPRVRNVYYLSNTTKRYALRLIKFPVNWIGPMGVPAQERHQSEFQIQNAERRGVLWVGAYSSHKRLEFFLSTMQGENFEITLVVPKTQHNEVQSVIDKLNITNKITVLSGLSVSDMQAVYLSSRVLVNTSRLEGFGMPILEALTFGCQCVVPNRAINRELFSGTVEYFPYNDQSALLGKIKYSYNTISAIGKINELHKHNKNNFENFLSDLAFSITDHGK